ncbi:MAG: preprotein translocase subunit YajC [Actinomycetota bacterium]|nr:preprotein translocase subunit YajC [Actinomycetota bacterium]
MEAGSLILLLLSVGLLALLFLRTRRHQQELMDVRSRLAPGQEVMTGSGMFATVVEVTDTTVLLRAEAGQTSRWDRRAVVTIVPEQELPTSETGTDESSDDQPLAVPPQDHAPPRGQDTDAPTGRA